MRFVWSSALKDLLRHRRDPVGLVIHLLEALLIEVASGKELVTQDCDGVVYLFAALELFGRSVRA